MDALDRRAASLSFSQCRRRQFWQRSSPLGLQYLDSFYFQSNGTSIAWNPFSSQSFVTKSVYVELIQTPKSLPSSHASRNMKGLSVLSEVRTPLLTEIPVPLRNLPGTQRPSMVMKAQVSIPPSWSCHQTWNRYEDVGC